MKDIFLRILITWLLFLPVPVINGILREKWYKALVGETAAHQIGTLVVSLFFVLYAYVALKDKIHGLSNTQLLFVGSFWLILTLIFEFGLGLVGGRSWSYMLADYKIWEGRIWPVVLIVVFLSPFMVKLLK